ncbi:MAG: MAPEG family protein [Gammaproteobacteria bacterium]|nr:MAPEG family protein [Gammaproteobacteria bacterium]
MEYVTLVVLLALLEYMVFTMLTGRARVAHKVPAPATTGNEIFERYYRVQQNTIEQLVIFLPSIYMFGAYVHELAAAIIGIIFIIGRALYLMGYVADPGKRAPGFLLSMLSNVVLLLGALIGLGIKIIG